MSVVFRHNLDKDLGPLPITTCTPKFPQTLAAGLVDLTPFWPFIQKLVQSKAFDDGHSRGHSKPNREALPRLAGRTLRRPLDVAEQQPVKFKRTVGVQADYRESETQTHPYSPEYVVRPGMAPSELLTLRYFTWGSGLPAGPAEMDMIDCSRVQRNPPLSPLEVLSKLNKKRCIEDKILERHKTRAAGLRDRLRQREEANEKNLQQYNTQTQINGERYMQKMHRDHERAVRKLEDSRRDMEKHVDHLIAGSGEAGPRDVLPKQIIPEIPMRFLNNYGDDVRLRLSFLELLEQEGELLSSVTEPCVKVPKASINCLRHAQRYDQLLKLYNQDLQQQKAQKQPKKPRRFIFKREVPVPRPSSPWILEPQEGEEEQEQAVIYLQTLLKGRSFQYQVLEGKETFMELILEMKTTNGLLKEEQIVMEENARHAQILQNQRDLKRHEASEEAARLAGLSGAELADYLSTMAKELVHRQEQSRLHAFSLLAEQVRHKREAEESGQRQVEEQRNREEDVLFTEMVHVHQNTVDRYLDGVIVKNIEWLVDQQARKDICRTAKEINASVMEESCSERQSQEVASELVHGFLIPEIQRILHRERAQHLQRKHLLAVHQIFKYMEPSEVPKLASTFDIDPVEEATSQVELKEEERGGE